MPKSSAATPALVLPGSGGGGVERPPWAHLVGVGGLLEGREIAPAGAAPRLPVVGAAEEGHRRGLGLSHGAGHQAAAACRPGGLASRGAGRQQGGGPQARCTHCLHWCAGACSGWRAGGGGLEGSGGRWQRFVAPAGPPLEQRGSAWGRVSPLQADRRTDDAQAQLNNLIEERGPTRRSTPATWPQLQRRGGALTAR